MAKRETQVIWAIAQWLGKQPNMWSLKVHGHAMQEKGLPDFIICHNGHMLGIEVKVGRNKPTLIQTYRLSEMRSAGATTAVVYSLEEFKKIVNPDN